MAKYLRVRTEFLAGGKLAIAGISEAILNYSILDIKNGKAKLTIDIVIDSDVMELTSETTPIPDDGFHYLIINETTSNRIPVKYNKNTATLATIDDSAELKFNFKLPGKTPGTLGSDSKTPGSLPDEWYQFG